VKNAKNRKNQGFFTDLHIVLGEVG